MSGLTPKVLLVSEFQEGSNVLFYTLSGNFILHSEVAMEKLGGRKDPGADDGS